MTVFFSEQYNTFLPIECARCAALDKAEGDLKVCNYIECPKRRQVDSEEVARHVVAINDFIGDGDEEGEEK